MNDLHKIQIVTAYVAHPDSLNTEFVLEVMVGVVLQIQR